jgi:ribosomal protein S18 acetylase RimI-like enzyme
MGLTFRTRWMLHHDLSAVVKLESACFPAQEVWGHKTHDDFLADPFNAALLAEQGRTLLGYLLYRVEPGRRQAGICQLAVHPDYRRRRIASELLGDMLRRLKTLGGVRILAVAADTQLPYHLFLRSHGFRAIAVRRGLYGTDDGYLFERLPAPASCRSRT